MYVIKYIGLDIGSTTVKLVLTDENNKILYKSYERHMGSARSKALQMVSGIPCEEDVCVAITGSAGMGAAKAADIEFVQEVYATKLVCNEYLRGIDAVIELGGEDAKLLFLTGGSEERMNGSCAGGTGAFIDQMASLLDVSVPKLDELSLLHQKIYNIASRCGVFAKSDIQPLLNQGAKKTDIAASIYQAIVDQTISGLAQGRRIKGRVAFLGGPLTYLQGLKDRFCATLDLQEAIFPENGEYYVALGAALYAKTPICMDELKNRLKNACQKSDTLKALPPLFDEQSYSEFTERHSKNTAPVADIATYSGDAYLGIDAGSTTIKLVLITQNNEILYSFYKSSSGDVLNILKEQIEKIYSLIGDRINIKSAAATGYGEELIKHAFGIQNGVVETVAHLYAAKYFNPNVDFIIDIGGQDIKCFKIKHNAIDSIMLNEACSSGCGSFIEAFAKALGYSTADYAQLALFAKHPVDLGSRCTVFMNSSVKQAQKDGAGVDDISAGLAVSVVKNALYKVIRASSPGELGNNIVVQGGTFLNDAILRSFEVETGKQVTRPSIAGLMGAFGAALFSQHHPSQIISREDIENFSYASQMATCKHCTNNCKLTINTFNNKQRFISGNRCERPLGGGVSGTLPNAYTYKRELMENMPAGAGDRGKLGLPLGLNMFENFPFWNTLFTRLGFEVVWSDPSTRQTYVAGQHTIPSDTVCYPAKLMHGHIENLLSKGIDTIFYPCMTYNFNEKISDNHFNCPVVAYYPQLIEANMLTLKNIIFIKPFLSFGKKEPFIRSMCKVMKAEFGIPHAQTSEAVNLAYVAYEEYRRSLLKFGEKALAYAQENGLDTVVLAGRPYHMDEEINHGIDRLINSLGLVVISEDCLPLPKKKKRRNILNQWTYHARLYAAAEYMLYKDNINLVQLVSFGCGLDAITTDEVREILEEHGKLYTQIKIDEINNLGAAKIRLRSLIAAIDMRRK